MKYRKIQNNIPCDALTNVLLNRGIVDMREFINPTGKKATNPSDIENMNIATENIIGHVVNGSKILVLVDSDCDGMTSGAMMVKILNEMGNACEFYLHEAKKHGLTPEFMSYIKGESFDLVIVPDAGSNDLLEIEIIVNEYKTDIIIVDHHEVEEISPYGIIVNNQLDETNKNLTGAGMVYMLAEALFAKGYNLNMRDLANLATMGLIGDSASLTELEVRSICINSLKTVENKFMQTVYTQKEKDLNKLKISDLSFAGVIPLINAVTRVGTLEEKYILFDALIDNRADRIWNVEKRKLNKETRKYEMKLFRMNLYQYAINVCEVAKARQDKISKKIAKEVEDQYVEDAGVQIIIIKNKDEYKGLTGLIANNLANSYQKPTIVCWKDKKGVYSGSLRGYEKVMGNFKSWCEHSMCFDLVAGHANASGVKFRECWLEEILRQAKEVEAEEAIIEVDEIYKGSVPVDDVLKIGENGALWGKGCNEPIYAITEVEVPKANIEYTKKTLRIKVGYVTFIKFHVSEEEYSEIMKGFELSVNFDIIGKFSINEWNNRRFAQIKINEYQFNKKVASPFDI